MGILAWFILGGLAGWIASIITGNNKSMGIFLNVITGIIGASIGGFIYDFFGHKGFTGFNWHSLWVSVVGATVLIVIVKIIRK